jgi:hypothetical protein
MADELHRFKRQDRGGREEHVIWRVPRSKAFPEGVKYRLVFIRAGEKKPAVLYDNHAPKGHHKHIYGREEPYRYVDEKQLLRDFESDLELLRWIH